MDYSNESLLDRPVWAALTTGQAHFCQGGPLARRYHPDVARFAALANNTPQAHEALHQILLPHEHVSLLSPDPVGPMIDLLRAEPLGTIDQIVGARRGTEYVDNHDVIALGPADSEDMLDLVQRTKPGPFGKRTHEMGNYVGIRDRGRLIAMAGERIRLDGYVEISAVCVDEDWRGRGIAGRLVNLLWREIEQRGEIPFMHVLSDNRSALSLYERLGFELRRVFFLTQVGHADRAAT